MAVLARSRARSEGVAPALAPLFRSLFGDRLPFSLRFWDGSGLGPEDAGATVVLRSPLALRRILYSPDEIGFGRAYVTGELDVEGDLLAAMESLEDAGADLRIVPRVWLATMGRALTMGVLGPPLPPPSEEAHVRGWRHSQERDAQAIAHHYDVGNDFYRLVLGPAMTYSCARFVHPDDTLEEAQEAKHELICAKLGLQPGMRLLDVGCGWGSLVRHAAAHHGVRAVGITLSAQQQEWGRRAVQEAGLSDRVEIRRQDYRDLTGDRFDAISSVGMFEHVGRSRLRAYFDRLHAMLVPGGRLLNHAISTPGGSDFGRRSFLMRYVFPDGELQDVGTTLLAMQASGFEARDVECLREHYDITLRRWAANLERHWDEAQALVGSTRARIWRLYITASVSSFERANISVHQALGVKLRSEGESGMPPTRTCWG